MHSNKRPGSGTNDGEQSVVLKPPKFASPSFAVENSDGLVEVLFGLFIHEPSGLTSLSSFYKNQSEVLWQFIYALQHKVPPNSWRHALEQTRANAIRIKEPLVYSRIESACRRMAKEFKAVAA